MYVRTLANSPKTERHPTRPAPSSPARAIDCHPKTRAASPRDIDDARSAPPTIRALHNLNTSDQAPPTPRARVSSAVPDIPTIYTDRVYAPATRRSALRPRMRPYWMRCANNSAVPSRAVRLRGSVRSSVARGVKEGWEERMRGNRDVDIRTIPSERGSRGERTIITIRAGNGIRVGYAVCAHDKTSTHGVRREDACPM